MSKFCLTNLDRIGITGLEMLIKQDKFRLYGKARDLYTFDVNKKKISFLVDGFFVPVLADAHEFTCDSIASFLKELYTRFGPDLIHHIKGNFILIMIETDEFTIFSDRIGIRKIFYHHGQDKTFFFTNCLESLTGHINVAPDRESMAIYSLMNHFIDGMTFLKEVFYSKPAARICFKEELQFDTYWKCEALLDLEIQTVTADDFSARFIKIVKQYIDCLQPGRISLSLTGGLDSRAILAVLLHLGIKPDTFTYGNPHSGDAVTAGKIAQTCGLKHENIYETPSSGWFSDLADEIVAKGNSLVHIHRTHRLFAVKNLNCDPDLPGKVIIFGGYMGGELIRNFFYDGLIISDFTREWINRPFKREELITRYLEQNFLKVENLDINRISTILQNQKFSGAEKKPDEFYLTFLLMASLYHAQDINLFSYYKEFPLAVYLDIDFLRFIFASEYNFMHRTGFWGRYMKRIKSQELYCRLIYGLSPQLAAVPFVKRGYYTPREAVEDNRLKLLGKRLFREIAARQEKRQKKRQKNGQEYPVNFSLGDWMKQYAALQLEILGDSGLIRDFVNVDALKKRFNNDHHGTTEIYWRQFTNPIFFNQLIDFYLPG